MILSQALGRAVAAGGLARSAFHKAQLVVLEWLLFIQPCPEPDGDILQAGLIDRVRHVVLVVDHI